MSRYYECDDEVADDFELQSYMNEVSADGIGSDGGLGNVRSRTFGLYKSCDHFVDITGIALGAYNTKIISSVIPIYICWLASPLGVLWHIKAFQ